METHLATPPINAAHRLQQDGNPLAIDEFGTGHLSLARLVDIPVSYLKIGLSLVAGVPDDPRAQRLLRVVMTIADDLDVTASARASRTKLKRVCTRLSWRLAYKDSSSLQ